MILLFSSLTSLPDDDAIKELKGGKKFYTSVVKFFRLLFGSS
jgi:hypothetical protein